MSSANWTAGGGDIDEWSWSGNDLTTYNSGSEAGGTTDGASTPIVAPADTEFEFHFTPSLTTGTFGPYTGVVPSAYSGDNNCYSTGGSGHVHQYTGSMTYLGGTGGDSPAVRYNPSGSYSTVDSVNYNGTACKFVRNASNYLEFYSAGILIYTSTSAHSDAYEFCISEQGGGTNRGLMTDLKYITGTIVTGSSATGSFNSTDVVPQDAVNKSSVGLVVLYKDNGSSSCTLNTDIVAKVRANTGQAYQTLVLASAGTYSDSLKIAIAPAISVTAGQALSYEISFANQSSGTKEARIYGVAMTY
jgi:hypothetical protein